jgi:hypothetical protein
MDSNIVGQSTSSQTSNASRFQGIYTSGATWTASANSGAGQNVMPVAGTLKNLYIQCDAGPGVGITRSYFINIANGANPLRVDLAGSGTGAGVSFGSDTNQVHNQSFAAGDVVSLFTGASGTTTGTGTTRWSLTASCAPNTSMLLSGSGAAMGTTFPVYLSVQSGNLNATSAGAVEAVMPTAGTIKNAYVQLNTAIATSTNLTFTLYKNGSPTSLAVVINTATATGNDTNAGHAVTVAAGDRLYWTVSTTAVPATKTSFISVEFDPTINGESVHMFGGVTSQTALSVRYQTIAQSGLAYLATEPGREVLTQAATWQKLYVYEQTSIIPGSYAYIPMINGVAHGPTVTISSGQTGNDTSTTYDTSVGDTISMRITPTSTPPSTLVEWGIVSYIAPSYFLSLMGVGT